MNNLHIGSGKIRIPGFTNIDIEPSHEPDICDDILKLDFPPNSVPVIYSCHFLEHLNVRDAGICLALCYKWLQPGGILRLAVPSLEIAAQAYVNGSDMKFLYGAEFKGYYLHDSPCERFNYFMKEWEHKLIYDYQQLGQMLFDAGFRNIGKKEANQSLIPGFNYDRFIPESLYVEAIK